MLRRFSFLLLWTALAGAGEPPLPVQFHHAPAPLSTEAVTADWPRFLGPNQNATSPETHLLPAFPSGGPALVWEAEKGEGHGAPVIAGSRLVMFHRWQEKERLDCLEAETGRALWSYAYEAPYRDRMGSGNGPRTSPVVADGRVFAYGVTGRLHCLDLATGSLVWELDCDREFHLAKNFFGHGSTPLVSEGRLIVQLGGEHEVCAAAFDPAIGKLLWKATHPWAAGYASPMPATFYGRSCVLLFAGGLTRPPAGGLLCLDATTGQVLNATPHRATIAESVNASSPVVSGNRVFISEAYGSGGIMVEIGPDFSAHTVWSAELGVHFMTPLLQGDLLVGSDGQSPNLAELIALDAATGRERWRQDLGGKFGRANLLAADGRCLCLGEFGDLAWMALSAVEGRILSQTKLFNAPETWTLPALSHGLLYILQNDRSQDGRPARLLCYDLRAP